MNDRGLSVRLVPNDEKSSLKHATCKGTKDQGVIIITDMKSKTCILASLALGAICPSILGQETLPAELFTARKLLLTSVLRKVGSSTIEAG